MARESMALPHEAVGHNLDSMGLFQQRPSASWGTPAQLMDPATSAGKFYDVLVTIAGYDTSTTPYMVAQQVQGSATTPTAASTPPPTPKRKRSSPPWPQPPRPPPPAGAAPVW